MENEKRWIKISTSIPKDIQKEIKSKGYKYNQLITIGINSLDKELKLIQTWELLKKLEDRIWKIEAIVRQIFKEVTIIQKRLDRLEFNKNSEL